MPARSRGALSVALAAAAALALASCAAPDTDSADLVSELYWPDVNRFHGGFSGIDITPDGQGFVVLSDDGAALRGEFERDPGATMTGIMPGQLTVLKSVHPRLIAPYEADGEGIALDPTGGILMAFEGFNRVWRFDEIDAKPRLVPLAAAFEDLDINRGLEAIAVDAAGAIWTIPEESPVAGMPFPVYRYAGGAWSTPFTLPRRGAFQPVGADFGPDGALYVLERRFRGLLGFASRVRRLELGDGGILRDEIVLAPPVGRHHNLEGLGVWRDASGTIRLTMVSDNNFFAFLRNEVVEYRLAGLDADAPGG